MFAEVTLKKGKCFFQLNYIMTVYQYDGMKTRLVTWCEQSKTSAYEIAESPEQIVSQAPDFFMPVTAITGLLMWVNVLQIVSVMDLTDTETQISFMRDGYRIKNPTIRVKESAEEILDWIRNHE